MSFYFTALFQCFSKKSKRRAHSDDYYIQQLIENDKQMLQNQQRQLQLDEQVSTAAVQFFNVMTEYLNKINATMQSMSEVPSTESKCFTCSSSPRSKQNTVPTPGCSKLSSDVQPSSEARTTRESDLDAPRTVQQVKRLCTTNISQNLKCNGLDRLINKVIALPQEEELEIN
jgi:cysteinyl-tRNA synthetase